MKHCRPTAASVSKRIIYFESHFFLSLVPFLKNDLYFYLTVCFSCSSGPASALGYKPHIRLFNSLPPVLLTLGFPSILSIQALHHIFPKFGLGLQVKSTHGSLNKDQILEHGLEGPLPSVPSCHVLSAPASFASSCFVDVPPFSRAPHVLLLNVLSL